MVSLGFATVENIMYVLSSGLSTAILRALTAVPAHTIFAIVMGYYISMGKFAHKKRFYYKFMSLTAPTLLHGTYDFILFTNYDFEMCIRDSISADLAIELCKINHVEGFKEASGDISQIAEIMARKPDNISIYSGNDDQILPILALGGDGVICTLSNIAPKLCKEITDNFFAGNLKQAREKQFEILDLFKAMFIDCNPIPVKTAMNMLGYDVGPMRLPLVPLSGAKKKIVYDTLIKYGFEASM